MKHLNRSFGVQLTKDQIESSKHLTELIDTFKVVVVDGAGINSEQDLIDFASPLGQLFPKVAYHDLTDAIKLDYYTGTQVGVDDLTIQTQSGLVNSIDMEDWHQDAASYSSKRMIGCAHVKTLVNNNQCIGDTSFCNLQGIYYSLSDCFRTFLKTLTVEHTSRFYREQHYFISQTLQDALKSNNIKNVAMSLAQLKSRIPRPFVDKFVKENDWINFSPKDEPKFLELSPAESSSVCELLKKQIANPIWQYQHRWHSDQVVLWDNRYVLHRRIDNAGVNTTRTFWRVQIEV
jgi:alpha-ketoglutarate-dependent taurine dioxygenase